MECTCETNVKVEETKKLVSKSAHWRKMVKSMEFWTAVFISRVYIYQVNCENKPRQWTFGSTISMNLLQYVPFRKCGDHERKDGSCSVTLSSLYSYTGAIVLYHFYLLFLNVCECIHIINVYDGDMRHTGTI